MTKSKMGICPRCKGMGYEEYFNKATEQSDVRMCTYCNGTGKII